VQTLTKWSAKIQAVAPSVLLPSNKGTFSKGKQNLKSAVQLVDETLLDHSKLLSRTQLRKAPGRRVGSVAAEDSHDVKEEVGLFDDTDFYQKMLRAIIDSRGDGKGSSDDWLNIQKQKKAKKNVDTKASKGRKLRCAFSWLFYCSTLTSS
jgi:protein AATF/BFR2